MWRAVIIAVIWICLDSASVVSAQAVDSAADARPLRIGTMHTPPFCIKDFDGTWSGISIDLWREIAYQLQFEYEFEELNLQELLDGVKNGELDAALAALTVTEDRELVMDFTHPHHSTGFAIATQPRRTVKCLVCSFSTVVLLAVPSGCRSTSSDAANRGLADVAS